MPQQVVLLLLVIQVLSFSYEHATALAPVSRVARSKIRSSIEQRGRHHSQQFPPGPGHGPQPTTLTLWATDDSNDKTDSATPELDSSSSDFSWVFSLLLPLWLVYVSNQWSRSSIYYLVDFSPSSADDAFRAMNVDLNFSESQYGLLASVAFTSLFAIASLVAGVASDRYNRKLLTIASVASWSLATLGTSLSTSYGQVVGWRIAMGLACAFSTPTAYTLIAQRVPKERAALASSLYSTGVALGGGLAALSVLLDTNVGWRNALLAIAVFGFGSGGLSAILLADDPKEGLSKDEEEPKPQQKIESSESETIFDEALAVIETPRVQWLFLGSFFRFCAGLCIGVWSAPYYRMIFPDNEADYAVAQAVITIVCGISSGLLGGFTADWVSSSTDSSNDPTGKKLLVPIVGSILAAPTWYFSVHSGGSFQAAMFWLAAEFLVAEVWFGPTVSVLQSTVNPKVGGTAQGIFALTGAIGNLAPSLLGFLYGQATTGGAESSSDLLDLLSTGVVGAYLLSAACFAASAQSTPQKDGIQIANDVQE